MTLTSLEHQDRYRGAMLGLACGDALGTTLEFCQRDSRPLQTQLTGGGAFGVAPGEWTDDTAMALCLADSLIACQGMDAGDQLERYCRWLDNGYLSCQGKCIDIGMTTLGALQRYQAQKSDFAGSRDPALSGNGGIMRLAPAVMAATSEQQAIQVAMDSSRTTHASDDCLDAAALMGAILWRLLQGQPLSQVLHDLPSVPMQGTAIARISQGLFHHLPRDDISSSGYVIDTLEAALWCCSKAGSAEEAIVRAANLGNDADTVAAVAGQLAGAAWGASQLPPRWLKRLAWVETITDMADQLAGGMASQVETPSA
ncbi:ADP-ribosylglycohydrolase family protein [Vreelandella rituensis]|nr:ADP-ribosylglycohydrolase family protein [Halomonas rituensis]